MEIENCTIYQHGHRWEHGEIDMREYPKDYDGRYLWGEQSDECDCGLKRTVEVKINNPNARE